MPAPTQNTMPPPDCDVLRLPDLLDWISRIGESDASVWASYLDYKFADTRVSE